MPSTGNDIIALDTINKQRSNDSRFYAKILSGAEQLLYQQPALSSIPFENYVWLCWSVKESAYKYLKRTIHGLVFSPTKISILQIDCPADNNVTEFENGEWEGIACSEKCYTGYLVFEGTPFYFRSKIYRELIATVVSEDENFAHTHWGIKTIFHTNTVHQSGAVRSFLLNRLHAILPAKDLRIEKTLAGYPIILHKNEELPLSVSFAHHGRFVAYSFLLQ
jgi:phosphopantetheinyl transferase (holo-ACP synthase)